MLTAKRAHNFKDRVGDRVGSTEMKRRGESGPFLESQKDVAT